MTQAIQKAFIEVNEEGAEAAAATGMFLYLWICNISKVNVYMFVMLRAASILINNTLYTAASIIENFNSPTYDINIYFGPYKYFSWLEFVIQQIIPTLIGSVTGVTCIYFFNNIAVVVN